MKTQERRTPPSTQALDRAVLALVIRYEQLTLQGIVSLLSYIWCDVSHEQVQASLNRLVVSGGVDAGHGSTSRE
jgi:hypothetical protein